jgi:cytochrome c
MIGAAILSFNACDGTRRASNSAFTQVEVVAGHASYHDYCSGCHRDDLQGGGLQGGSDAPPLTGPTFKNDWSKYSVQALYRFVSKTMPEGLEGDLRPNVYSNIISFLLAANGAKPGTTAFNPNNGTKIGDIANGQTVMAVIEGPTTALQSSTPNTLP